MSVDVGSCVFVSVLLLLFIFAQVVGFTRHAQSGDDGE
jgi:hypothetical protein